MDAAGNFTQWTTLADELMREGYEIIGAATPAILGKDDGRSDIGVMAVALVARSLSNMRGVLTMIHDKRIVEARVLARCILENQFWAAGFAHDPDKFRQTMIDHDLNKRRSSGQMLFDTGDISDEIEKKLRRWMRENKNRKDAESIAPKRVARDAQVGGAYLFYDLLSTDAHPTVRALDRYLKFNAENELTEIVLDPEPTAEQTGETLGLACYGLLVVLMLAAKILGLRVPKLDALAPEYLDLMRAEAKG